MRESAILLKFGMRDSLIKINKKISMKTKKKKMRNTTLIRTDRSLKEEVKGLSKRIGQTMSQINDCALREYLDSMKPLD